MAQVISIELPFFAGFYESVFYNSDMEYYAIREDIDWLREQYGEDLNEDDFEVNWKEYTDDVCHAFCDVFNLLSPDFIQDVEFDEMTSPKYYNYSTDRIFANVTFDDDWKDKILSFMKDNKEWLEKRISKDWTSYDGFMSFMDNNYDSWLARFLCDEVDERYIYAMIAYIMYKDNENIRDEVQYSTMEDIYISTYLEPIKKEEKTA